MGGRSNRIETDFVVQRHRRDVLGENHVLVRFYAGLDAFLERLDLFDSFHACV